jgi:hypothetical protein
MSQLVTILDEEEAHGVWRGRARIGPIETNFSFQLPLSQPKEKLLAMVLLQKHLADNKPLDFCPACGKPLP